MKVVFRVDAARMIGTGHVMRCMALAHKLAERGAECHFVCRAFDGHMGDEVLKNGFSLKLLPVRPVNHKNLTGRPYAEWLGADVCADVEDTLATIASHEVDWLVLDHYAIDQHWEAAMCRHRALQLLVIDGQANRSHICDALLDPTYAPDGASRWQGLLPAACKVWSGPQFALFRPEFDQPAIPFSSVNKSVSRILVSFGGVDFSNITERVLKIGLAMKLPVQWDVLLGGGNPHIAELKNQFSRYPQIQLHVQPTSVSALMRQADMAISAGGTTVWELLKLGIPTMVVSIAENQKAAAEALGNDGYVSYAGDIQTLKDECLEAAIKQLESKPELRAVLRGKALGLMQVDAQRPWEYMMEHVR